MPRGNAEFTTMDIASTKPGGEPCTVERQEPHINQRAPKLPGDPMRNLLERDVAKKGFTRQMSPIKNNGVSDMRGNAEFVTMKGFDDIETKGSATQSTAEQPSGTDVAKAEKLSDKADKKAPPKGGIKVSEDDITMDPELKLVEEGPKKDIEDTYVSDIQGSKVSEKGYEDYNRMVTKGMAADLSIDPYDVKGSMAKIADNAGMVVKELDGGIEVKGPRAWLEAGRQGLKKAASAVGEKVNRAEFDLGKRMQRTGRGKVGSALSSAGGALKGNARRGPQGKEKLGRNIMIGGGATLAGGAGAVGASKLAGNKEDKGFEAEKKSLDSGVETKGVGRHLALTAGIGAAGGAATGAGTAALLADKKQRAAAAERGAKYGAIGGLLGGPIIGGPIGGALAKRSVRLENEGKRKKKR